MFLPTEVILWLPAIILSLIGIVWYLSFPSGQKHNHNLEAVGLIVLGIFISLFAWSLWFIYDVKGTEEMKLKIADKVVWSVIFGVIGSLSAIATLTIIAIYKRDDNSKTPFKRHPKPKKKTPKKQQTRPKKTKAKTKKK